MRLVSLLALAGCWSGTPRPPGPSEPVASSALVMTQRGVGPIDAATVTTLLGLRKLLPRYRVIPLNDPQLEYDIFDRKEKLAFIVLTEGGNGVFNIHVTSGKVTIADRAWRVGKAFTDAKQLGHCECWGDNPTCYKAGDHIAVNFDHACVDPLDGDLGALDGVVVQRLIWSPQPFGAPADEPEAAP
ncbi:MAG: hypothetical protein ABI678_19185 [Kofleriaceae bacterium]